MYPVPTAQHEAVRLITCELNAKQSNSRSTQWAVRSVTVHTKQKGQLPEDLMFYHTRVYVLSQTMLYIVGSLSL